jgi:uncharacterized damage-inducible protein DinB
MKSSVEKESIMPLSDLLLPEFDTEIKKTRVTLERVPHDQPDFKPHDKSMALVKLANHTAEMPMFLSLILTLPELDFKKPGVEFPKPPASHEERLERFDAMAAEARGQLAATADEAMHESWKLSMGDYAIFDGTRYQALRSLFFNHMIHHRAQLGVYLRMTGCPVPSIYGPSADEK